MSCHLDLTCSCLTNGRVITNETDLYAYHLHHWHHLHHMNRFINGGFDLCRIEAFFKDFMNTLFALEWDPTAVNYGPLVLNHTIWIPQNISYRF